MLCSKCGTNNQEGVNFCVNCGNPLNQNNQMNNQNPNINYNNNYQQMPNQNYNYNNQNNKSNGKYTASVVLGIISIIFALFLGGLNLIISIIGLVLGAKAKKEKGSLGMVLNVIGLVLGLIVKAFWIFIFYLAFIVAADSEGPTTTTTTPEYIGNYTCGMTEPYNTDVEYDMSMSLYEDDSFYLGSTVSSYTGSFIVTEGIDSEYGSMELYNVDENSYNKYTINLYIDKKNGDSFTERLKYAMFYFPDYDALELHSFSSSSIVICKRNNTKYQGL